MKRSFIALFVLMAIQSFALDFNDKITYQGRLISGTNLVNGVVTNVFRLYSASAGGMLYFSQTQAVTVVDGFYSTRIGDSSVTPSLYDALTNLAVFIEVEVNGIILSPRERIYQVAYALTAVRKTGDTMTGNLRISSGSESNLVIDSDGDNVRIGQSADATEHGVAVGTRADAWAEGVAIGFQSDGLSTGVAVGVEANGGNGGAAVGRSSSAFGNGAAVGKGALANYYGAALGQGASGGDYGIAIGNSACGSSTNIAIGYMAAAGIGSERIAIGHMVSTPQDNATAIRGTLFLDGATGIYYRSTFGSGGYTAFSPTLTNYVRKSGDTMSGTLTVSNKTRVYREENRDGIVRAMLIIEGGDDIEIGQSANGYNHGAAVGGLANGNNYGAAVGVGANGQNYGAVLGNNATGTDFGVAIGADTMATNRGTTVGEFSRASDRGAALGYSASGNNYGVAVGQDAQGGTYGTAVGSGSRGYTHGIALGERADGITYGIAIGNGALGNGFGTSIGYSNYAAGYAVSIGTGAKAYTSNIAIGVMSYAASDWNIISIGEYVTNSVANSARLRGTLYLDGATGILYRTTFGSGPWSNMLGNVFESDPVWTAASNGMQTQINARLASNTWAAAGSTTNYVRRTGDTMSGTLKINSTENALIINSDGTNIAVGAYANGGWFGTAVGNEANSYSSGASLGAFANAYWYGVAAGFAATGRDYGVAFGISSFSTNHGVAIGNATVGSIYGAAVGAGANANDNGAALGYGAIGRNYGVAVGRDANSARTNIAIGVQANALLGAERISVGHNVTNNVDNTAVVRGTLYLDGGTSVMYRTSFGTGTWSNLVGGVSGSVTVVTNVTQQKSGTGNVTNVIVGTATWVFRNGLRVQ